MAFVVQMIFRIAGSKAGNGITSFEALRQAGAMDAFPCPLFFERVQHRGRLIRRCRGVDFTQTGGQGLAVLPGADVQRMADQVDDAGLDGRLRESGGDRLGEALQPVNDGNRDVLHAPVLQLGHHREPEPGAVVGQNSPLDCFETPPTPGDPFLGKTVPQTVF